MSDARPNDTLRQTTTQHAHGSCLRSTLVFATKALQCNHSALTNHWLLRDSSSCYFLEAGEWKGKEEKLNRVDDKLLIADCDGLYCSSDGIMDGGF